MLFRSEIADGDAVQRFQAMAPFAEIGVGIARLRLNERIISGLEIKERVERIVDQRIGKGMDLQDRPVREMDVQQPLQSPLDMGEHIGGRQQLPGMAPGIVDRSEEHTSELQSLMRISYAVSCWKKKQSSKRETKTKKKN